MLGVPVAHAAGNTPVVLAATGGVGSEWAQVLVVSANASTAAGVPIRGLTVLFQNGDGGNICSAVTNANGNAVCAAPESGLQILIDALGWGYNATFAGDGTYALTSAHGNVVAAP